MSTSPEASADAGHLVAVIADTHLPARRRVLPPACLSQLLRADLIIHAGDICDMASLGDLRALGPPVVAVHGNVDEPAVRAALPATAEVTLAGVRIGVVHDAGPAAGRPARLARRFPACDLVVFGHSHIPLMHRPPSGPTILNPGSPTDRRRQPRHSMALVRIVPGAPTPFAVAFLAVDDPPGPLDPALVRG